MAINPKSDPDRFGEPPPCFDSKKQWVEWNKCNEVASIHGGKDNFCHDCMPDYAKRMRTCGRCLYHEIKFYDVNGGVIGAVKTPNFGRPYVEKKKPNTAISAETV